MEGPGPRAALGGNPTSLALFWAPDAAAAVTDTPEMSALAMAGSVERPDTSEPPAEHMARMLSRQAAACRALGSPLDADLLSRAAADLQSGGPTADVLDGYLARGRRHPSARFAYLYLEQSRAGDCPVTLTTWPGGRQRVLGVAPPHGIPVTWRDRPAFRSRRPPRARPVTAPG